MFDSQPWRSRDNRSEVTVPVDWSLNTNNCLTISIQKLQLESEAVVTDGGFRLGVQIQHNEHSQLLEGCVYIEP